MEGSTNIYFVSFVPFSGACLPLGIVLAHLSNNSVFSRRLNAYFIEFFFFETLSSSDSADSCHLLSLVTMVKGAGASDVAIPISVVDGVSTLET